MKTRLTRVINQSDPQKIIQEVDYAEGIFEEQGYPDFWVRWQRAKEDAQTKLKLARKF